jgi:NAD+ diphosphatase
MNFFSANPLNRLSWLRPSHTFLNAVIKSPETRWILFNAGDPLTIVDSQSKDYRLVYLATSDVLPLLGPAPFFGQGEREGNLKDHTASSPSESARLHGVPIVFLGLHENDSATATPLLSSDFNDPDSTTQNFKGTPYFALDVAELESAEVDNVLKNSTAGVDAKLGGMRLDWTNSIPSILGYLDHSTAGIFAQARIMVDWNRRNKVGLHFVRFDLSLVQLCSSALPAVHQPTQRGVDGNSLAPRSCPGPTKRAGNPA